MQKQLQLVLINVAGNSKVVESAFWVAERKSKLNKKLSMLQLVSSTLGMGGSSNDSWFEWICTDTVVAGCGYVVMPMYMYM